MLTKLMKRDLRRDYILMLVLTAVIAFIAILVKLCDVVILDHFDLSRFGIDISYVKAAFEFVTFIAIVLSISFSVESFRKSMLNGECYLTHTLPVKASELLLSKMLTSYIWAFLIMGTFLLSDYLLFGEDSILFVLNLSKFFDGFKAYIGIEPETVVTTLAGLFLIFVPFMFNALVYFFMSITTLCFKNRWLFIVGLVIALCVILVIYASQYNRILGLDTIDTNISLEEALIKLCRSLYAYFVWIPLLFHAVLYFFANFIFTKKLNIV